MRFIQTYETSIVRKGRKPYYEYRIPSIRATGRGTLLICFECRAEARNDWSRIDICLMRSEDKGRTWSREMLICSRDSHDDVTWNNPTLTVDADTVHMTYCRNYERVYDIVSKDDGVTWSEPNEITDIFQQFGQMWNVRAVGPGHGIRAYDGTLYLPIWLADGAADEDNPRIKRHWPSVAGFIYANGGEWRRGGLIPNVTDGNETTAVELSNGDILFNIRNRDVKMRRALAQYSKKRAEFSEARSSDSLVDPMCFGSMEKTGDGRILFSNCQNASGLRTALGVSESSDDGATWQRTLLVDEIGGYSDMAVNENELYILYERTIDGEIDELRLKSYKISD